MKKQNEARACILCNVNQATTREHFFKKDIYREIFNGEKGIYIGERLKIPIQGPNSKHIKADKYNLCETCNTAISQGPDRAFAKLDRYLRNYVDQAPVKLGAILSQEECKDVIKYFAKHFACQLDRGGREVPEVLRNIFLQGSQLENLEVTLSVSSHEKPIRIMENQPSKGIIEGLDGTSVANLFKIGVFPEKLLTGIRHNNVKYEICVRVPITETVSSAKKLIFQEIENAPIPKVLKKVLVGSLTLYLRRKSDRK